MADKSVLTKYSYDDSGKYVFGDLERAYGGFLAPTFLVSIDSKVLDSTKVPISSIEISLTPSSASGCSLTINAMYDYETGKWAGGLLEQVAVGQDLAVAGGYAEKQKLLFKGFITSVSIQYTAGSAPSLSLRAMDGMQLMMSNRHERDFGAKSYEGAIKEVLAQCQQAGVIAKEELHGNFGPMSFELDKSGEISDYEFLKQIATANHLVFQVINNVLLFTDKPWKNYKPLMTLTMGVNLYSFTKNIVLERDSVESITVQATNASGEHRFSGEAREPSVNFGTGKRAAQQVKQYDNSRVEVTDQECQSNEACQLRAQALLDEIAMSYISGQGTTIGIPELIPTRYIQLEGMDGNTNGLYYISEVTHKFTSEGYTTDFSVKGMKTK